MACGENHCTGLCIYCVKSVRIRSFFGLYFPAFGLNSIQIRENTDQNNSEYRHFSHSDYLYIFQLQVKKLRIMQVPTKEDLRSLSTSSLWKDNDIYLIHLVCSDNRSLSKVHTIHETVYDVLIDSCDRLKLNDPSISGLAVNENNEYKFISPKKRLVKVLLKEAIVTSKQAQELYLKNVLFDGN